ncbi:MAG: type II toxin-antitoxin system RelB/DinJ family antitoxin [Sedimentisphaerales bacterium]|nr:type II toxin-antitoxin system RelB/DinJ family antitoxin [Sedimentisphaerales bacterium]
MDTKQKVVKILNALHIDMSEAIKMYLKQIILNRGIPFELKIPNELTAKTIAKAEANQDLHEVADVDELFRELDI